MKRYLVYTVFSFLLVISCAPFSDVTYHTKISKNPADTKEFRILQYKDSIFPNQLICDLKKVEKLTVDNSDFYFFGTDPKYKDKYKDRIVMVHNIPVNTDCLDSLTSLKNLTIGGFTFDKFPLELSRIQSLEVLWLTYSSIAQAPTDLRAFRNLRELNWEEHSLAVAPDSIMLPKSLHTVRINAYNMNFSNRVKLIKSICRNPQVESIAFHSKDQEERCIIYNVIKSNALNDKVHSVPLRERIACNEIEKSKSNYRYE